MQKVNPIEKFENFQGILKNSERIHLNGFREASSVGYGASKYLKSLPVDN